MVPEGAQCISLGPQTPLEDIRRAAHRAQGAHRRAVVLGRVSRCGRPPTGSPRCAASCPPQVTLWAGGEMTRRVRKTMPGVVLIPDLASTINALRSWRSHWVPQPAAS